MPRILRLPPDLANQIAAGEVVERPASVVKELVENALDAGARRIAIQVELGGKRQVRVEDDGDGMSPEDARLAIERHATSKIARAEDLAAIRTLGFRGEALPSIASVSHFVLRTRARGAESGTQVEVNGGAIAAVHEVAAREGTAVEVNDLFYNLPARRKFMKSDAAESAQVSRVVTQLALAHHEVGFALTSGSRPVLQCPPVESLKDRLYQLYGDRTDLVEVRKDAGGLKLTGFVAALADRTLPEDAQQGPVRGPQNLFVNRRIVRDRTVAHAIIDAYSRATIKEKSPEVHLFIEMSPEAVDVNVHPTKAEVRFRDQSLVHEVVRRALMDALGEGVAPELQLSPETIGAPEPYARSLPGVLAAAVYPSRWTPGAGAAAGIGSSTTSVPRPDSPPARPDTSGMVAGIVPSLVPLGQFRDTFIIAVDADGIAIIDQHVAHERVLFERIMEKLTAGRLESQRLLVPIVMDVAPSACEALLARQVELERSGFEIEAFGASTIKVAAVPALLRLEYSSNALLALAEDLEGLDRGAPGASEAAGAAAPGGANVQLALQRIAATTACHSAVRANDPLTYEKMVHILAELRATAYSTVCPHGRPVMLRLTRREIEKNFERI